MVTVSIGLDVDDNIVASLRPESFSEVVLFVSDPCQYAYGRCSARRTGWGWMLLLASVEQHSQHHQACCRHRRQFHVALLRPRPGWYNCEPVRREFSLELAEPLPSISRFGPPPEQGLDLGLYSPNRTLLSLCGVRHSPLWAVPPENSIRATHPVSGSGSTFILLVGIN